MKRCFFSCIVGFLVLGQASAQFSISLGQTFRQTLNQTLHQTTLGAEINGQYDEQESFTLYYRLRPVVIFGQAADMRLDIQDLYLSYERDDIAVHLGWERLALERARLSIPYVLDAFSAQNERLGRFGARLTYYVDQADQMATRYRLVVTHDEKMALVPVLSIRQEFQNADVEGHVLWRADRAVFGLSGSVLLEPVVLFAETWLQLGSAHASTDMRAVAGFTGNVGRNMWVLEGGYASVPSTWTLAGQYIAPQGEFGSWTGHGLVTFTSGTWQFAPSLTYTHRWNQSDLSADFSINGGGTFGVQNSIFVKLRAQVFAP